MYDWEFWARDNQLTPEGKWLTWLLLAGRGFGKTRTGAEFVRAEVEAGRAKRIALVAPSAADARDVMIEGDSGLLSVCPPWFKPVFEPSKRRVTWPNGAIATYYSAEEPEALRGPQHDLAWIDELGRYRYAQDVWDMLQFGLRLGKHPRQVVTTTPRNIPILKKLITHPKTFITKGSTMDNKDNLAESFMDEVFDRYGGTRLGRQELEGELVGDNPGALWNRDHIHSLRLKEVPVDLQRIVVAIDPSGAKGDNSEEDDYRAEVGIIVAGRGSDRKAYILEDGTVKASPKEWAKKAVRLYEKHKADCIVVETNYGGAMVTSVLQTVDPSVPIKTVSATRGKVLRAEPVSAIYEQGAVHHIGMFSHLEDEMCNFLPDGTIDGQERSPNRLDALVWALTDLMLTKQERFSVSGLRI